MKKTGRAGLKRRKPLRRAPLSRLAKEKKNPYSRYWKRLAIREWSRIIRGIGFCEKCGKQLPPENLNAHHLLGRQAHPVYAASLENGVALCARCHRFAPDSAHGEEAWRFGEWFRGHIPHRHMAIIALVERLDKEGDIKRPDWRARYEALDTLEQRRYPPEREDI